MGANGPSIIARLMASASLGIARSLCMTTTTSVTGSWQPATAASSSDDEHKPRSLTATTPTLLQIHLAQYCSQAK
jgi:hypothetical protein